MKRWWILLGLLIAPACSDDSTGPGSSAPVISNLQFSPSFVYVTSIDTPGVLVAGSVDFVDTDGDLALLRFTTTGGADLTVPLQGLAGITRGSLVGTFLIPPGPVGEYGLTVWVQDAQGHRSNELSDTFGIRIDSSGTGWTGRPSGTTVQLNRVIRGNQGYLAVGYGGVVLFSPDGVSWTGRSSGTMSVLWGACWSGSRYVLVGDEETICTSIDGVSWTTLSASLSAGTLYSVAWSGSLFAAVGTRVLSAETEILTSPDGITWDVRPAIPGVQELRAVVWAGNRFLAAGVGSLDSTIIVESPDGVTWTVSAATRPTFPRDVVWSGTTAVVAGGSGSMLRSQDGNRWEIVQTGSPSLSGVTWSGSRFIAVGVGIYSSVDGALWQLVSQEQGLQSVVWAGERFIAVGFGGTILTSP